MIALTDTLTGPREERTHEAARARIPMTAANVRSFIDQMEAETRDIKARKRVAKLAIAHGNITPEGKDVYREYLELMK